MFAQSFTGKTRLVLRVHTASISMVCSHSELSGPHSQLWKENYTIDLSAGQDELAQICSKGMIAPNSHPSLKNTVLKLAANDGIDKTFNILRPEMT